MCELDLVLRRIPSGLVDVTLAAELHPSLPREDAPPEDVREERDGFLVVGCYLKIVAHG